MSIESHKSSSSKTGLIDQVDLNEQFNFTPPNDESWIEVIHKMDEVYADLVKSQVELEKKNAELEDAHKFIRSVLTSMTDVLIVCDTDGRIEKTNTALETLIGRREKDLKNTKLVSLFTSQTAKLIEDFPEKLRADASVMDCEVTLLSKHKEEIPLAVNCASRYDHKGRLVGLVLIGRPIGELRRAYDKLDQAHKILRKTQQQLIFSEKMAALGRLVAGVAHELNNPISFVFGNMHALKRYGDNITSYMQALDENLTEQELEKLRRDLKIDKIVKDISPLVEGTLEGAERVSEIVQDLRRFSGNQKEIKESFDLPTVLRTATNWVVKTTRGNPTVNFKLPDKLTITARKGHIHQIIVNLVQNAFDIMADQSDQQLDISCKTDAKSICIHVKDYGPGIADKDKPHIFEPFYTTKPIGEGTGLGLYVSYGMAEEQGGTLEAKNHKTGGAVFTLRLPLELKHAE